MTYQINLTEEAKLNLKEASHYYFEISPSSQEKFQNSLINTIDGLKEYPKLHHQIRYRNIRVSHVKDFPFAVHFIIENKIIHILKILHHQQFYK